LLNRFTEINKLTKAVKQQLYKLLVEDFKYLNRLINIVLLIIFFASITASVKAALLPKCTSVRRNESFIKVSVAGPKNAFFIICIGNIIKTKRPLFI